MFLEDTSEK